MIATLSLVIELQDLNNFHAITDRAMLYFNMHSFMVLTFCIAAEFKMNFLLCRIPVLLVKFLYQVTVFYSISTIFKQKKDEALNEGYAELSKMKFLPLNINKIIQFWIIAETTFFGASLITLWMIALL